jgi:hypothetical protein
VRDAVDEVLWVAGGAVRRGPPNEMLSAEHLDELFATDGAREDD